MQILERIDFLDAVNIRVKRGEYWGKDGAIEVALKSADLLGKDHEFEGLSIVSNIFYSAGMNALAHWKLSPWWFPNFPALFRYYTCISDAESHSNIWTEKMYGKTAGAEKLLVRAEILFGRDKYKEAEFLVDEALDKSGVNPNVKALLLILIGKIYWAGDRKRKAMRQYQLARDILAHVNPSTSVRVRMAVAENCFETGDMDGAMIEVDKALEIARYNGLYDLVLQLRPLADKLHKYREK